MSLHLGEVDVAETEDPVLKIWVTFLATGLKRRANISNKLNHETFRVSLGTVYDWYYYLVLTQHVQGANI